MLEYSDLIAVIILPFIPIVMSLDHKLFHIIESYAVLKSTNTQNVESFLFWCVSVILLN